MAETPRPVQSPVCCSSATNDRFHSRETPLRDSQAPQRPRNRPHLHSTSSPSGWSTVSRWWSWYRDRVSPSPRLRSRLSSASPTAPARPGGTRSRLSLSRRRSGDRRRREPPRGQVDRDAERLVITEDFVFRTTPRLLAVLVGHASGYLRSGRLDRYQMPRPGRPQAPMSAVATPTSAPAGVEQARFYHLVFVAVVDDSLAETRSNATHAPHRHHERHRRRRGTVSCRRPPLPGARGPTSGLRTP